MYWYSSTCLEDPLCQPRRSHSPAEEPFRPDLIERIRREIAEGVYETPEKWQAALERLLDRLEQA
jgi:hypothetical protein